MEKIKLKEEYQDVHCPDYGNITLLPYLSLGAIQEFFTQKKDTLAAFLAMLKTLTKERDINVGNLTDNDISYLASYYAKILKVYEIYKQNVESGKSSHESFELAFYESSDYKSMKEMVDKGTRIVMGTAEAFKDIESSFRPRFLDLQKMLDNFSRRPFYPYYGIEKMVENLSRNLTTQLLSSAPIINSIREASAKWQSEYQRLSFALTKSVTLEHQKIFKTIDLRMNNISRIISTQNVHSQLLEVSKTIQKLQQKNITFDLSHVLKNTNAAILNTTELVVNTSDFFTSHGSISVIIGSSGVDEDSESPELKQISENLMVAAEDTEDLLQEETSLAITNTNTIVKELERIVSQQIGEQMEKILKPYGALSERITLLATPQSFINFLKDFAVEMAKDFCDVFWETPGDKFVPSPERLAKSHLGMFLKGLFRQIAFVGKEIGCGDGFIDLIVSFLGMPYIVELKIVGSKWGIGWAKSGLKQLDSYMEIYGVNECYLVVFDGRKTRRGEQLESEYNVDNGKIHVLTSRIYREK